MLKAESGISTPQERQTSAQVILLVHSWAVTNHGIKGQEIEDQYRRNDQVNCPCTANLAHVD